MIINNNNNKARTERKVVVVADEVVRILDVAAVPDPIEVASNRAPTLGQAKAETTIKHFQVHGDAAVVEADVAEATTKVDEVLAEAEAKADAEDVAVASTAIDNSTTRRKDKIKKRPIGNKRRRT